VILKTPKTDIFQPLVEVVPGKPSKMSTGHHRRSEVVGISYPHIGIKLTLTIENMLDTVCWEAADLFLVLTGWCPIVTLW
jgi:hypothetical protein